MPTDALAVRAALGVAMGFVVVPVTEGKMSFLCGLASSVEMVSSRMALTALGPFRPPGHALPGTEEASPAARVAYA